MEMLLENSVMPKEAAEILGITHSLVCVYCREGRLKATKKGIFWFIDLGDLEEFKKKERKAGNPNFRKS